MICWLLYFEHLFAKCLLSIMLLLVNLFHHRVSLQRYLFILKLCLFSLIHWVSTDDINQEKLLYNPDFIQQHANEIRWIKLNSQVNRKIKHPENLKLLIFKEFPSYLNQKLLLFLFFLGKIFYSTLGKSFFMPSWIKNFMAKVKQAFNLKHN